MHAGGSIRFHIFYYCFVPVKRGRACVATDTYLPPLVSFPESIGNGDKASAKTIGALAFRGGEPTAGCGMQLTGFSVPSVFGILNFSGAAWIRSHWIRGATGDFGNMKKARSRSTFRPKEVNP